MTLKMLLTAASSGTGLIFFFLILSVGATVCIYCSCLLLKVTHPNSRYFSLANKMY